MYELKDKLKFEAWLNKMGAVVQPPTNKYEVVRFRTVNGTSVIYTGKRGLTFTGDAETAYERFTAGKSWRTVTRARKALRARKATLAARDGKRCFAHGEKMTFDQLTIEHLLNFSHGGSDNDNNLALVCDTCNGELGNLPITKKIEKIMQLRNQYLARLRAEGKI